MRDTRKFRYVNSKDAADCLTTHEKVELREDYDIDTDGYHVLAPLTKAEWESIVNGGRDSE